VKEAAMAEDVEAGCARPTGGPVGEEVPEAKNQEESLRRNVA